MSGLDHRMATPNLAANRPKASLATGVLVGDRQPRNVSGLLPTVARSRLLLDVTATESSALKTGIQRVTLELFVWLVRLLQGNNEVIAIYLKEFQGTMKHFQANAFMHRVLGMLGNEPTDDQLVIKANDTILHLDLATTPVYRAWFEGAYANYQAQGIRVFSLVYDLLPIRLPDCFPPEMEQHHRNWLQALSSFDGALCISQDVAQDVRTWFDEHHPQAHCQSIDWFELGADIGTFDQSRQSTDSPRPIKTITANKPKRFGLNKAKTFLMVGTIEPRKAYADVLDAFDALWRQGFDCRLILVGRAGWTHLPEDQREAITQVIDRLDTHKQKYRKLVWLSSADDDQLALAYRQADCLIAASYGEGLGLPIIEAISRSVPVLARDIAVFREVATTQSSFFTADNLMQAIANWQPPPDSPPPRAHTTWQDSTQMVINWLQAMTKRLATK
jgi:glycosyltransferase involved in cell wall biosynthesis